MNNSLQTFATRFNKAKHLIIPNICDYKMPTNIIFPNARTLTVYWWDKNGVYYNLDRHHFPNVERINYISGSPGDACVPFRFISPEGPTFKWRLPTSASTGMRHHRFFDFVPEEYKEFIPHEEYKELVKEIDAIGKDMK